jgi:hypothetical protein
MFVVNEQISMSIDETPKVIKSALKDTEFFICRKFVLINRFLSADIDKLLGERITREIAIQTGLDSTFESTVELLGS